ncbi:MAG: hypothetical protein AAF771_03670 [Pseudomonadota bacterium]
MAFVADVLLLIAALGAGAYCIVLSRRLSRFTDLEKGVGGAIAVLSVQVDDMTRTLKSAQTAASDSANSLGELTGRAEAAARRLELLVASLHDLPDVAPRAEAPAPAEPVAPEPADVAAARPPDEIFPDRTQPKATDEAAVSPAAPNGAAPAENAPVEDALFLSNRMRTGAKG